MTDETPIMWLGPSEAVEMAGAGNHVLSYVCSGDSLACTDLTFGRSEWAKDESNEYDYEFCFSRTSQSIHVKGCLEKHVCAWRTHPLNRSQASLIAPTCRRSLGEESLALFRPLSLLMSIKLLCARIRYALVATNSRCAYEFHQGARNVPRSTLLLSSFSFRWNVRGASG